MANQIQDIKVAIKVDGAGQAYVQIDKLGGGFMKATTAAKKLQEAIKQQNPVLKGSVADYQRQISALKQIRDNSAKTANDYNRQTIAISKLQTKMRALTATTQVQNKVNEAQISNAGLAGATLTEFGRTISDLPYGIRGVANNLSQLSTLFVTLIAKSDGAKNAFKQLLSQLRGPLGFILAFQAIISLIDFFAGSVSKATEETDALSKAFKSASEEASKVTVELDMLLGVIQDSGSSTFDFDRAVKQLRNNFPKLVSQLDIAGVSTEDLKNKTDEARRITDAYTDSIIKQAKARAILSEIEKIEAEKLENELKLQRDLQEEEKTREFESRKERIATTTLAFGTIIRSEKEITSSFEEQSDRRIKKMKEEFDEKQKLLNQDLEFLTSRLDTSEVLESLDEKTVSSIKERGYSVKTLFDMELEADDILTRKTLENSAKRGRTRAEELKELKRIGKALLSSMSEAFDAEFEADVSIEERKTTIANNELKKRLRNESLSASEKEGINNQIAANEEALQVKRDKLAEKNFKQQKALSIVQALMSTYEMATDAFATIKGMKILGPAALPLAIAAAATATAFGLKQVAAIKRTKFVPSAIGGSGGGAGGAGGADIQAPDFNVVGASETSQLAETVAGQQAKPVKAFVVGKDISTQQELDRNISNTASF